MSELHVPTFAGNDPLRQELAAAAARATSVAITNPLSEDIYFVTARKHIRTALHDHGIAQEIEELVNRLLSIAPHSAIGPFSGRKSPSVAFVGMK